MEKKTFAELCADAKKNVKECNVNDVMDMMKNSEDFHLVDIREDNEFNAAHIKGAKHVGRGILERDIHLHVPSHDQKIVLYCGGGFRSALSAESIQKMGYSNVISMDGGWKGWNAAGGEIE
ncbi:MAG: rhodanese-like domain-containing protein [bacterium]|nr:rhodanese-like domain-containing protein [bacterium]